MLLRKILSGCIVLITVLQIANASERRDSVKAFKIAGVLQSNMVIQQNKPMKIWGFGAPGDEVTVQVDWSPRPVSVHVNELGNWIVLSKVPKAVPGDFTQHTITVTHQNEIIKLTNILIGEVWICSGQSNMEFRINKIPNWSTGMLNWEQESAAANYPNIRLFKVEMGLEFSPMADCKGSWQTCTPTTAGDFSAVGYFFGKELYNKLNIPIGLVDAAIPATACQAFTDINILNGDDALKTAFVDPYTKGISDIQAKNDKSTTLVTLNYPGLVYNKMIYPLRKLSVAGFAWYQGESNKTDTLLYAKLCTAMLEGWRKDFEQGDLPFYYVQVTPYSWLKGDSTWADYAKFREEQGRMLKVKNTGMAITMDVGERDNIHPLNKKPVGIRLADIALAKNYRMDGIACQGPQFKGFKVDKDTVRVRYQTESIASGLKTNDGKAPKYFYIAGADRKFHRANAKIVNDMVVLYAPEVHKPVAVRYAFTNFPVTNFENAAGLPAVPFRTDDW